MGREGEITRLAQRVAGQFNATPALYPNEGRLRLLGDGSWVIDADPAYGANWPNITADGGDGGEPVIAWDGIGRLVPKGRRVARIRMFARTNSNLQIDDVELRLFFRRIDPGLSQSGWTEADALENLYSDSWKAAVGNFSGDLDQWHRAVIPLDFETQEDGQLIIAARGVGLNATRYFFASYVWEVL